MPTFIYQDGHDSWRVDAVMLEDRKRSEKWLKKKLRPDDFFIGIQEFHLMGRFALDRFRRKFGHDLNPGFSRSMIEQILAEKHKDEIVFNHEGKDISAAVMLQLIDECSETAIQYTLALSVELRNVKVSSQTS